MSFAAKDARLARRGEELLDAIVANGSLVLRKVGGGRSGEVAAGRFLDNDDVSADTIVAAAAQRTLAAARGRDVLAIHDTTEVNFSGRGRRRIGLGPAGDGTSPGLFCHPLLLVDIGHEAVLGIASAAVWTRPPQPAGNRKQRPVEDKESRRWLDATHACAAVVEVAARVVSVADREADIYAHFASRPASVEMIVRARHDRATLAGTPLFDMPEAFDLMDVARIEVPPRGPRRQGGDKGGDKGRDARVSIKAGRVEIVCPAPQRVQMRERGWPPTVTLGLVEIAEIEPPAGVKPVCWRLLTTLPVATLAEASEVARLYRLRWRIEQLFRTFKSDGLDVEATQVTEARRLFKLAALGLIAAARIMALVDARDGGPRPATDVIDADQIPAVTAISARLEGGTARQKNHHPAGTLAWVAWVAARLGGWNCYYKPPGPKTMADGWLRLAERLEGYDLAMATKHV